MAEANETPRNEKAYVDESGWTSMEPEGAGHHPHILEEFPDIASQDRWEDDFGGQAGGDLEDHLARDRSDQGNPGRLVGLDESGADKSARTARGPIPAEGDGWGAPE